jgi:hypothetical protein
MDSFPQIAICCIFGAVCAVIANSKGRNSLGWFFCGFFFTIIGLIIIVAVSNLKEEQERAKAQLDMTRRLLEQRKRDQQKIENLQRHALSRLQMHDEILGIDTEAKAPSLNEEIQIGPRSRALKGDPPPRLSSHTVRTAEQG